MKLLRTLFSHYFQDGVGEIAVKRFGIIAVLGDHGVNQTATEKLLFLTQEALADQQVLEIGLVESSEERFSSSSLFVMLFDFRDICKCRSRIDDELITHPIAWPVV